MKKHIKQALAKLQQSPDLKSEVEFSYQRHPEKKVIAKVFYNHDGKPAIGIKKSSGYNIQYISAKLNSSFETVINEDLPSVQKGDRILIRSFSASSETGRTTVLTKGTYYYAVNDGIVSCNGRKLARDFNAQFIDRKTSTCATGTELMDFLNLELQ